jgi:hypothetical protein
VLGDAAANAHAGARQQRSRRVERSRGHRTEALRPPCHAMRRTTSALRAARPRTNTARSRSIGRTCTGRGGRSRASRPRSGVAECHASPNCLRRPPRTPRVAFVDVGSPPRRVIPCAPSRMAARRGDVARGAAGGKASRSFAKPRGPRARRRRRVSFAPRTPTSGIYP